MTGMVRLFVDPYRLDVALDAVAVVDDSGALLGFAADVGLTGPARIVTAGPGQPPFPHPTVPSRMVRVWIEAKGNQVTYD